MVASYEDSDTVVDVIDVETGQHLQNNHHQQHQHHHHQQHHHHPTKVMMDMAGNVIRCDEEPSHNQHDSPSSSGPSSCGPTTASNKMAMTPSWMMMNEEMRTTYTSTSNTTDSSSSANPTTASTSTSSLKVEDRTPAPASTSTGSSSSGPVVSYGNHHHHHQQDQDQEKEQARRKDIETTSFDEDDDEEDGNDDDNNNNSTSMSSGKSSIVRGSSALNLLKNNMTPQLQLPHGVRPSLPLLPFWNTNNSIQNNNNKRLARWILIFLIFVGVGAATSFISLGIFSAIHDHKEQFESQTRELVQELHSAFQDYEVAVLWVQEACRDRSITRQEFSALYYNLLTTGLEFKVISFNPNTTHTEREALEEESRIYYNEYYPNRVASNYVGIRGLEEEELNSISNSNTTTTTTTSGQQQQQVRLQVRSEQPFYFPVHFLEPIEENIPAIDFDLYSSTIRRKTIEIALSTWLPALTPRLHLVQDEHKDENDYSVILMHPGIPIPHITGKLGRADSFSSMAIRIPDLLQRATSAQEIGGGLREGRQAVYIFDTTQSDPSQQFLGGALVRHNKRNNNKEDDNNNNKGGEDNNNNEEDDVTLTPLPEVTLQELRQENQNSQRKRLAGLMKELTIPIASSRTWTIAVVALDDGSFEIANLLVIAAGVVLFVLCVALGIFVYINMIRMNKLNQVKTDAERDRAILVVESAEQAARAERELNDFIAHEVRNPLSAAMSACNFISTALIVTETEPLLLSTSSSPNEDIEDTPSTTLTSEQLKTVQEDIQIIDTSLGFINDLLRTFLDAHRASSKQMQIEKAPTNLLQDILQPVDSMLHRRDRANFTIEIQCIPQNLIIMTDKLRLKQVILNLARNSMKFVEQGFVRMRAEIVKSPNNNEDNNNNNDEGMVQLSVEDSGPGIPIEKRRNLFGRFQESLDVLSQGTGIGLSLCKTLTELMGGELWVDEDYDSGIPGCPGARFVVNLNVRALQLDDQALDLYQNQLLSKSSSRTSSRNLDGVDTTGVVHKDNSNKNKNNNNNENHQLIDPSSTTTPATLLSHTSPSTQPQLQQEAKIIKALPENLSVLFVDDDFVLRKLFSRSVKRVAPTWKLQEASDGETALRMVDTEKFDIIFMDQYMASVQKTLLGTETTRALRAKGVKSIICGLSANDAEESFYQSGANAFLMKPFPCQKEALQEELVRVIGQSKWTLSSRDLRSSALLLDGAVDMFKDLPQEE